MNLFEAVNINIKMPFVKRKKLYICSFKKYPQNFISMEVKIQELTEKLYLEGVEKGEKEAERLIEEAQNRRKALMEAAQEEAKEMVNKAQKQAGDLKKNTEAELKLYAAQTVEALKSEVTNLLNNTMVNKVVKSAFSQTDFMQKIILKLVSEWPKNEQLTIGAEDATALKAYFDAHAKELLDKGLKIEQINGKKHAFTIAPADGTYKINFGEEEFIEYFKEFLRPQLIDLLF
jgi:V/A-type H+-transporting ATPase subunit E